MAVSSITMTVITLAYVLSVADCNKLARGWRDDINWVTLDKARELAVEENKPVMVIIHKTWCGACKSLRAEVAKDEELAKYSSNLIMVNLEDDEEPKDASFAPDGGYVPRIFILSAGTGKVDASIYNVNGNQDYKYFYYQSKHLLTAMKKAVEMAKKNEL